MYLKELIKHCRNVLTRYNGNIYAIIDTELLDDDNKKNMPFVVVDFSNDIVDEPQKGTVYLQEVEDIFTFTIFLNTNDRRGTQPSFDIEQIRDEFLKNVVNCVINGKIVIYKGFQVLEANRNATSVEITLSIKHQLNDNNTARNNPTLDDFKSVKGIIKNI